MQHGTKRMIAAAACEFVNAAISDSAPRTDFGRAIATLAQHAIVKALVAGCLDGIAEVVVRKAAAEGVDLLAAADGLFTRK